MIEIYSIRVEELPSLKDALALSRYADAWKAQHPNFKENDTARASLGGLLLLEAAGLIGILHHTDKGRPFLEEQTVDFNITHTSRHVLCAVSRAADGMLGLDAEELDREHVTDRGSMAKRWFSNAEQALFLQDPTEKTFLRIWTRKEAYVKRTGMGLSALRDADTLSLPIAETVGFYEYELDGMLATLCAGREASVPKDITVLTKNELHDRLSKQTGRSWGEKIC